MITVSDAARERVARYLAATGQPDGGLRLTLFGAASVAASCADPVAEIDVRIAAAPEPGDRVRTVNGVRFFLPHEVLPLASDAELSLDEDELTRLLGDAPADLQPYRGAIVRANREAAFGDDGAEDRDRPAVSCRPPWLVWVLSFASLGAFAVVWYGRSWAELKRVLKDDSMHPWWHALTVLVPIYSLFRLHEHFSLIHAQANAAGRAAPLGGGGAVFLLIVANGLGALERIPADPRVTAVLELLSLVIVATLAALGQGGLNAAWSGAARGGVPARVHWLEWVLLVVAVPWILAMLVGLLLTIAGITFE